jgi:phage terminase large subunit
VTSDAKNICFYGSSRSGKSFLIMRILLIRASKTPLSDHLIVRETFSSAKASIWQKTLPDVLRICFPELSVSFNNTDYVVTLSNGSTIKIAGLDDQKKIERLLGTEYSSLWYNESNQIPLPAVNKLKTRLAQKNKLKKMAYFDLNPTKTSSWTYQLFEEKVNPQDGEMLSDPDNYLSVQMNVQSNIGNIDDGYIEMLEGMPEAERKRFLDGEYDDSNQGKAVYAFNKEDHVTEDAKRQHGSVFIGSDFNIDWNSDVLSSMTNDHLMVWDEVQIAGDTFKKADALKRKGAIGASIIADSTGKARRTSGKSDHIILKEAGFHIVHTINPLVIDKIANLNRAFTLGIIRIHPRCKKLIRDLTQLVWDKHGQLDQKTDPSLSHLVDSLAYLVWCKYPLMDKKPRPIRLS